MMGWNWKAELKDICYMDLETQSLCNLKQEGGRKYAEDPSTRISLAAFRWADKRAVWVFPGTTPPNLASPWPIVTELPEWVRGKTLCAHNAGEFDKLVWDQCVREEFDWIDSMPIARAAGLPGGLDKIASILLGRGKHELGYALINMLCQARVMSGEIVYPLATAAAWNAFIEYCCLDVDLLAEFFPLIHRYCRPEMLRVHQSINDRGIPVDTEFAARLVLLQEELRLRRSQEFEQKSMEAERGVRDVEDWMELGVAADDVRSVKKVLAWLQRIGIQPPLKNGKPTLERKELARLFKEPEAYMDADSELDGAVEALKIRFEVTRATAGKAKAALRAVNRDQRARGQHVANGAHTGRFSGRDMQPHNFLRGVEGVDLTLCRGDLTLEAVYAEAERLKCSPSDVIATLLRPMIAAKSICTADFGAIEARGVAWFCEEDSELALFRQWGADPYLPLASQIFGRACTKDDADERWVAKQAILGCGYGMSWKKFITYCASYNVDLLARGIDAKRVVDTYRSTHQKITQGWTRVHAAAHLALDGQRQYACRCEFFMQDSCLHIQLPSGRCIVYRNPRIVMEVPGWAVLYGISAPPAPTLVYDHPQGYRGMLYGGRIMENIVQGGMCDVLVEALIRCEDAGLNPFMSVHDEILCESDELQEMVRLMSLSPDWAPDLPVFVEGWRYPRYVKKPPKGALEIHGLIGETRIKHGA